MLCFSWGCFQIRGQSALGTESWQHAFATSMALSGSICSICESTIYPYVNMPAYLANLCVCESSVEHLQPAALAACRPSVAGAPCEAVEDPLTHRISGGGD